MWVIVLIAILGVLVIFLGSAAHVASRRVIPNKYEWLAVLSHTEWKPTFQLKKEMESLKGTSRGGMLIYSDLDDLEDEKLVTRRDGKPRKFDEITFQTSEYLLTSRGTRKKVEVGSSEKVGGNILPQPI